MARAPALEMILMSLVGEIDCPAEALAAKEAMTTTGTEST
jgi:hypothetical protein